MSAIDHRELLAPEDREVVDLYYDDPRTRHGHAYHVVAAFVLAGLEPPFTAAFDSRQSRLVQDHYDHYDPHGSRAAAVAQRQEEAGL